MLQDAVAERVTAVHVPNMMNHIVIFPHMTSEHPLKHPIPDAPGDAD
jgi:hypothetical protein